MLGHTKILHTLTGMGTAALVATEPCVRQPEFPTRNKEVLFILFLLYKKGSIKTQTYITTIHCQENYSASWKGVVKLNLVKDHLTMACQSWYMLHCTSSPIRQTILSWFSFFHNSVMSVSSVQIFIPTQHLTSLFSPFVSQNMLLKYFWESRVLKDSQDFYCLN